MADLIGVPIEIAEYREHGLKTRATNSSVKTVTLYTRLGCHLCEVVEATIVQVAALHAFAFIRRDISEDPVDYELYKNDIPVVLVDGVEIARHRLAGDLLIRALRDI